MLWSLVVVVWCCSCGRVRCHRYWVDGRLMYYWSSGAFDVVVVVAWRSGGRMNPTFCFGRIQLEAEL